jgi:SH3-like domain-containing protein
MNDRFLQVMARFCFAALLAWGPGLFMAQSASAQQTDDPAPKRQVERPGRTGLPLPRFVSLRAPEVNLRTGPGIRYPIDWVYRRRGLPVEVIDEFETWRRIRDHEGTVGWVHQSMLDGQRRVLITGDVVVLRRSPESDGAGVARLEPGVSGRLDGCRERWCQITVESFTGWLERDILYGLYPGEDGR